MCLLHRKILGKALFHDAVDVGCRDAFFLREERIAAAQGKAVALADNRTWHDLRLDAGG